MAKLVSIDVAHLVAKVILKLSFALWPLWHTLEEKFAFMIPFIIDFVVISDIIWLKGP